MAGYDIVEAFQKIEEEMIASMSRNLKRHLKTEQEEGMNYSMWQAEQLAALNNFRKNNQKAFKGYFSTINSQIETILKMAHQSGAMDQETRILSAIKKGWKASALPTSDALQGSFFKINERKLNALIEATTKDMAKAETAMLRMADDEYRKTIFNAEVYYNSGAGTLSQCVDMATKDFLSKGISCIEYANGARVGIDSYASMALRTAQTRAYLQGESVKRDEWGVSTVIVNKRGVACPRCLKWVGRVYYDDVWGNVPVPSPAKYPRLSEAMAGGLYHPNCKDIHTTYFEGINTPPEPMTKEQKEEAARVYDLEQEQRYNERQIRKYKRLVQGSVDPENQLKYQQKLEAWQTRQRDFVKANGDVLKRRYENEKLRVPDFPEPPSLDDFNKPDNKNLQSVNQKDSKSDIIKCKNGHKYVETVLKQPSCTVPGEKVFTCSVCGDHYKEDIPALGHDLISSVIAPTCTDKGYTLKKCQRPGCSHEEKTDIVPALGHDIKISVYDPTCTAEGYTIKWCTRCNHREKTDIKPALGHDWGDWVITRKPTTALEGRKKRVCKRCGISGYGSIPKLKAPSVADQIKALQDSLTKLQSDIDDLNKTTYSNIWKDPVTVSDYPYKKSAIAAKKQYFMDQLSKTTDPTAQAKWQSLLDLTDEFDIKGQEYEKLLAERQKNQDALDILMPASAKPANKTFTPDAYGNRKTTAWNNRFRRDADADAYYRPIYDKQCGILTDEHKFSIWQYTHNSHPMNRPLSGYDRYWGDRQYFRGLGKISWSAENDNYDNILQTIGFQNKFGNKLVNFHKVRDYKDTIADLTKAIDKCEFDIDTWVVRGSGVDGLAGMLDGSGGLSYQQVEAIINSGDANQLKALIGKRGRSHSFTSTGIVDGKGFSGSVSYKIYMPKGTKAVYAEPQSFWGDTHYHKEKIYKPGDPYSGISHEAEIIIQRGTTYRITDIRYTYGTNVEVIMEVVDQPDYFKTGYEHTYDNGLTSEK